MNDNVSLPFRFFLITFLWSGNRPFSGLYAHGLGNAFIPFMPTMIMQKDLPQPHFWFWVAICKMIEWMIYQKYAKLKLK